ncbi:MAG: NUMOD4 motif-containing HNH endonuclease [Alphaproteobacteria bacterium]|jgi:hypothetical protein
MDFPTLPMSAALASRPPTSAPSSHSDDWRIVPGWPEYEISRFGQVRRIRPAFGAVVGRLLKPLPNKKTGYVAVVLCHHGRPTRVDIHRLVALAFHGPQPSAAHLVAHNDGVRTNNHTDNLRWATQRENLADRRKHGTALCGSANPAAKLDEIDRIAIHQMKSLGLSRPLIAAAFGVHKRTIFKVLATALKENNQ